MATLYNADRDTFEYIEGGNTEAFLNPMYNIETHDISDKYLYNQETSSLQAPPPVLGDEKAYLESGSWSVKKYLVGTEYWGQDGTCHVIDGPGVEVPDGCVTTPPPTKNHLTHDGTNWILDIPSARQEAISNVRDKRRYLINEGVSVNGVDIQSDDKGHANMACYVAESIVDGLISVTWECACGADHVYTVQEIKPIFKAIATYRDKCFDRASELKSLIAASDEPLSINIETGWPSTIITTV